jgi:hypothetical protein
MGDAGANGDVDPGQLGRAFEGHAVPKAKQRRDHHLERPSAATKGIAFAMYAERPGCFQATS